MTSSSTYEKLDVSNGDLTDLINDIKLIKDNEELIHIWNAVKNQWDNNIERALSKFYVGQDVECKFKDDNYYPAVVEKINKKTVGIKVSLPYNRVKKYNVNPRWLRNLETN
jgi:site-specific DNA-adenine methylase